MRAVFILLFLTLPLGGIVALILYFQDDQSIRAHINAAGELDDDALVIAELRQVLKERCIKELSDEELTVDSIKGMLQSIPHSKFEQDSRKFQEDLSGKFTGIGIVCQKRGGKLIVVKRIYGSEAFMFLQEGDEILQIDRFTTDGLTAEEANEKLKGKPGTICKIHFYRPEKDKPYNVNLIREVLTFPSAFGERILDRRSGIGYLSISKFQQDTGDEVKMMLQALVSKGLKALVIDLRFNTGGLLDIATKITNLFIAEGLIVETRGRTKASCSQISAQRISCLYPEMNLAVLINGQTASAAEVLAGALQDHGRAKLVGTRSYGKGVVQASRKVMLHGKARFMTYPAACYYLPSGRCIDRKYGNQDFPGLQPDIEVKIPKDQYLKLKEYLERMRLAWDSAHEHDDRLKKTFSDPQLREAIRLLKKK